MRKITGVLVWRLLFAALLSVVIASCDSDNLNVVPGDDLLDPKSLKDGKFLTDDFFAPVVESISLYDVCGKSRRGENCKPSGREIISPESGQEAVSSPARVIIKMNKPVYIDSASQVDIVLGNASFKQSVDAIQPLSLVSSAPLRFKEVFVPSSKTLKEEKYQYFTTKVETGDIYPEVDGVVTITLPEGIVYDINANDKKVYNKAGSGSFVYDTSRPVPHIKVLDDRGNEVKIISANSVDFGNLQLEIDWGVDELSINALGNIASNFSDPSSLIIDCIGCGTSSNSNVQVFKKRVFNSQKSAGTKYYVTITEDIAANEVLTNLADGAVLSFSIVEGLVEDAAKNTNKESNRAEITVDAASPKVKDIHLSAVGSHKLSSGQRVLSVGDSIRYRLTMSEAVALKKPDDITVQLFAGTPVPLTAKINFSASGHDPETGGVGDVWELEYVIQEEVGDNFVADVSGDYKGVAGSTATVATPWLSDINQVYNVVPARKAVFDLVGNPLDTAGLKDREFSNGSIYQRLHIDAKRPRIVNEAKALLSYAKRLSGNTSIDVTVVPNGGELAIAIPFTEVITDENGKEISFSDSSVWDKTTVNVNFYNDAIGSSLSHKKSLKYNHSLTQLAQGDAHFSAYPHMVVYSATVDSSYPATKSIKIDSLEGLPGGVEPASIQDRAGNLFWSRQAGVSRFSVNTDVLGMMIDGGPFSISSIYPMYENDLGAVIPVPESVPVRGQKYMVGDSFYVGMQLAREVSSLQSLSPAPPKLKLRIQSAGSGGEVELESSSVRFGSSGSSDIRSILVFEFDLSANSFEDSNGVEVVELSDSNDRIKDENMTSLVYKSPTNYTLAIDKALVRDGGASGLMSQVWIDNKAPLCSSTYLTDKASGVLPSSYYTVKKGKPLYLAVQCNQAVVFNEPSDVSPDVLSSVGKAVKTDRPFVYGQFGEKSLGVIFNYSGLAQAGKRIIYSLPIELGYSAGTNAEILVGESGKLSITKFYNKGTGAAGEYNFFTDSIGNIADLRVSGNYFVKERLYEVGDSGAKTGTAITVDTNPVPLKVEYLLDADSYKDSDGVAYIAGGDATADGRGTFAVKVDYGYFDASGDAHSINLMMDGDEDLSIDLFYVNSSLLAGRAALDVKSFLAAPSSSLLFKMKAPYVPNASLSKRLIKSIQSNQAFNSAGASYLPYAQYKVSEYNADGSFKGDVSVNKPVSTKFYGTTVGVDAIPRVRLKNSRPVFAARSAVDDVIPFEVWVASGSNLSLLAPLSETGRTNLDSIYFGDIYFAVVFDVDMSEDSFKGTVLNVDISNDQPKKIDSVDMEWVDSDYITSNFATSNVVSKKKVFYRFSYGDSKYVGRGYSINRSKAFELDDGALPNVLGAQQDIYGNYVDLTTVSSSLDALDDVEVKIEALADIKSVEFDKELYLFNDTINVKVETKGRLKNNLPSNKVLAVKANITRDESATAGSTESSFFFAQKGSAVDVAPNVNSNPEGSTLLTFSYKLDDPSTDQFNDDNTRDTDRGISFSGAIHVCDPIANSKLVENCVLYNTKILDIQGNDDRSAGLGIAEVPGVASLAGVNSLMPYIGLDTNKKGIGPGQIVVGKKSALGIIQPVTSSTNFKTGDSLFFDVAFKLQRTKKFSAEVKENIILGSVFAPNAEPNFHFYVFDVLQNKAVRKDASYVGVVDGSNIRFEYVVVDGDYAGSPGVANAIVLPSGVDITADRLVSFDATQLISSPGSSGFIDALKDREYGNPVSTGVYDLSGDAPRVVRAGTFDDVSVDIKIDSRAFITGFSPISSAGSYKENDTVEFAVTLSSAVSSVSSAQSPEFIVSISEPVVSGSVPKVVKATAVYSRTDSSDPTRLIFQFKVPADSSGKAVIESFIADGKDSFIRSNGININPNVGLNTSLPGLVFDTLEPEIVSVTRRSPEAVYSKNASSNNVARIQFGLNKEVEIKGVSTSVRPSIDIEFDTKSGSKEAYTMLLEYNASSTSGLKTRDLTFEINLANLSDEIQDYDGISVVSSSINLPAGVFIADLAGNNLNLSLDLSSRAVPGFNSVAAIELLKLDFDTSIPQIVKIIEMKGGDARTQADYSADSKIVFKVSFDEEVGFSNSVGVNYYIDVSFDSRVIKAEADIGVTQSGKKDYNFILDTGSGHTDMDGLSLLGLSIVSGANAIQDLGGNDLNTSLANASVDLSNVRVDAERPYVTVARVPKGTYSSSNTVNAYLAFNEEISVSGSPAVNVLLDTTITRAFSYHAGSGTPELAFTYVVDKNNDSDTKQATVKSPIQLAGGSIVDAFGNNAEITFTEKLESDVLVRPNQGAVVTSVKAYASVKGAAPTLIDPAAVSSYGVGDILYMEVAYSEAIDSVTGVPTLKFNVETGAELTFDYTNDLFGQDAKKLTFELSSLPADTFSPKGIETTGIIGRPIGSSISVAGTIADPSYTVSGVFDNDVDQDGFLETIIVDTLPPKILDVSADQGRFKQGDVVHFNVNFDESVDVSGSLSLVINVGGTVRTIACTTCSATVSSRSRVLQFSYAVNSGENALAGVTVEKLIFASGASVGDALGNRTSPTEMLIGETLDKTIVDTTKPTVLAVLDKVTDDVGSLPVNRTLTSGSVTDDRALEMTWFYKGELEDVVKLYGGAKGDTYLAEVEVDQAMVGSEVVSFTTPSLSEGSHILRTKVFDAAGNEADSFSAGFNVTVDLTAPDPVSLVVVDNDGSNTKVVTAASAGTSVVDVDSNVLQMQVGLNASVEEGFRVFVKDDLSSKVFPSALVSASDIANKELRLDVSGLDRGVTYKFLAVVTDKAGNESPGSTIISIRVINPPLVRSGANGGAISVTDNDNDKAYSKGDVIHIFFNQPVEASELDITKLSLTDGKVLGTGATISPSVSGASSSEKYDITLGDNVTVTQDVNLIIAKTGVLAGKSYASDDLVFTLPDITPPKELLAVGESQAKAVTVDSGLGNDGKYGENDQINLLLTEGIDASLVNNNSVYSKDPAFNLGTGYTVSIVGDTDGSGYASTIQIKLGAHSSQLVGSGQEIGVKASSVKDAAGNLAINDLTYKLLSIDVPFIKDISINQGLYRSGENVLVNLVFSKDVTVNLNGSSITISLNVGGSTVTARYDESLSNATNKVFVYPASGVVDLDGIEVIANSVDIAQATLTSTASSSIHADIRFPDWVFPSVKVDAPFDFSKVTDVWFDSTDIDSDGDIADQKVGDMVTKFYDKSGRDNHISSGSRGGPELKVHLQNNNNLSTYFDGTRDDPLEALKDPKLGTSGYTYFAAVKTVFNPGQTWNLNYLFGTRKGQTRNGVGLFLTNSAMFHLNSSNGKGSVDSGGVNIGVTSQNNSIFMSESHSPGISRIFSQGEYNDQGLMVKTNLVPGGTVSMGALNLDTYLAKGYVNEVFYFNRALTLAEKAITENYLASKWASPEVIGRDYYTGDNSGKGDYDYGVVGILKMPPQTVQGQTASIAVQNLPASNVSAARVGALLIASSSLDGFLKDEGDRVFAGSKNGASTTNDLPSASSASVSTVRSGRVWYLDIADKGVVGGHIDIKFSPSLMAFDWRSDPDSYELLWRSGTSGDFKVIASASDATNDVVSFNNISVNASVSDSVINSTRNVIKNGYIALGMVDKTSPEFRYADITKNDEITLTFDESIARPVSGFSVSGSNVLGIDVHVSSADKVVITTNSTVSSVSTLTYGGTGISDAANNFLASLPSIVVGTPEADNINLSGDGIVVAGAGDDTITASSGADVFDYNSIADGNDTIIGFAKGTDKIDLSDLLQYSNGQDISKFIAVSDDDTNTTINIDAHGRGNTSASTKDISIQLNGIKNLTLDSFIKDKTLILVSP